MRGRKLVIFVLSFRLNNSPGVDRCKIASKSQCTEAFKNNKASQWDCHRVWTVEWRLPPHELILISKYRSSRPNASSPNGYQPNNRPNMRANKTLVTFVLLIKFWWLLFSLSCVVFAFARKIPWRKPQTTIEISEKGKKSENAPPKRHMLDVTTITHSIRNCRRNNRRSLDDDDGERVARILSATNRPHRNSHASNVGRESNGHTASGFQRLSLDSDDDNKTHPNWK